MTLKLFVADDSVTIQKIVGLAFSSEDALVQAVSNGDSALDEVRAFKPDIVLADVFMPGCNGYEVCEHIKEDPELKDTPVILLVGTFEPFDEAEASRVKCDGYLTKPFDTSELVETVHRLIKDKDLPDDGLSGAQPQEDFPSAPETKQPLPSGTIGLVSSHARASFLGSGRVLELFDPEVFIAAGQKAVSRVQFPHDPEIPAATLPMPDEYLSEEVLDIIVDRVVRRMSTDVVREVAWEVVPDLSEVIIRRTIEEQNRRE